MKRLTLLLAVTILPSLTAAAKAERPILALEAGGHSADVMGVAFTADGHELISASKDHTIRFWDVKTGEPLRVLRLPVYPGADAGKLALLPGGRLLAVSLGGPNGENRIALIEWKTGRVVRTLDGHEAPIWALEASPDGKLLASGSRDNTARVWDVASGRCVHVLREHRSPVTAVAFSPDSKRLATACYDTLGRVYDLANGAMAAELKEEGQRVPSMCGIGWSPDGQTLATGALGYWIQTWSPDGTLKKKYRPIGPARSLRFSADGRRLLYAGNKGGHLLGLQTGEHRASFTGHGDEFAWSAAFSPDEKLAATGGRGGEELVVWKTADGEAVYRLAGKGRVTRGVGWSSDGRRLGFGQTGLPVDYNRADALTTNHPLERSFDPGELTFASAPDDSYRRPQGTRGSLSVERTFRNGYVTVKDGEEALCTLETPFSTACTFVTGDRLVVASRGMHLYDARTGRQLRSYTGHLAGSVHAIAPSPDGRLLATSASDQTLRIWAVDRESPLLSLYVAGDEWIAWTEEGYYACSAGGERLMGWQVNYGAERLASFHPAEKFRKSLYRPDILKRVLKEGSVERAVAAADRERGRASEVAGVAELLPPVVVLTAPEPGGAAVAPDVTVRFVARPVGKQPITAARLMVNGRPYPGAAGLKTYQPARAGELRDSWKVHLPAGRHTLAVRVETTASAGVAEPVEVRVAAGQAEEGVAEAPARPSLYMLAVGVSAYPKEWALDYAAKDATSLARACQKHCAGLFGKVEVRVLTDREATRRGILQGLGWLRKQASQRDVVVLYFGGHGVRDADGSLYLLPVDGDPDDLLSSAVSADQVKQVLQGVPGRALLLLDACHAGAAGGDRRRNVEGLVDSLVRDLATDDYGVVVMCASMGRESSLESSAVGHGFFTLALLEALAGKGGKTTDGAVYLHHVEAHVAERVKELSKGKQHPVTARPTSVRSFPLARP